MTIRKPPENFQDKILRLLGKERRLTLPKGADEFMKNLGAYVLVKAKRESFFKALFTKRDE